jgi:hypothetical protein
MKRIFQAILYASLSCVSIAVVPYIARTQNPPNVAWSSSEVNVVLGPGAASTSVVTFQSSKDLENVTLQAVPAISGFLSIQPSSFAVIKANQSQQVLLSFAAPAAAATGSVEGTIHIQAGRQTLPQTLKVTVSIVKQRVGFVVPAGFAADQRMIDLGGPVSLNNFGNHYEHGGLIPPGGAEIYITDVALPPPPLLDFIAGETVGALTSAITSIAVAGSPATKVVYTDLPGGVRYRNVAIYVPRGTRLFKLYLFFRDDDPQADDFLAAFQQVISTITLP